MSGVSCPFWRFKIFCQHSVDGLCLVCFLLDGDVFFFFDVFVGEGEHVLLPLCHLASTPRPLLTLSLPPLGRWVTDQGPTLGAEVPEELNSLELE